MTWFDALAFTPITLVLVAALYSVRSLRKIGSKLTAYQVENRNASKKILGQLREINSSLQVVNLLTLNSGSNASSRDWSFVLSFTSHPARFASLPELLPSLASQLLQPIEIHFNVAKDEADQLSPELLTKLDKIGRAHV